MHCMCSTQICGGNETFTKKKKWLQVYNQTRIDHFRAFAGYWSVDASAETAMIGDWRKGPGAALFDAVERRLGDAAPKIMAEDLGVITTDVKALRRGVGAPGMVVLQFAWGGGADNTHLPHNHYANSFVYPGTHDNETAVGWYNDSATVRATCGHACARVWRVWVSLEVAGAAGNV